MDAVLTHDDDIALESSLVPRGFELIDGQLVEKQIGMIAGWVGLRMSHLLEAHRETTKYGWVFGSETTYRCFEKKRTARKPDVSFIRPGRLKKEKLLPGECHIPPDLAVEVVSPNDTSYEVTEKVEEYLAVGVCLVWVIDPQNRVALVYRSDHTIMKVREGEELNGEDVVPGFKCSLEACLPPADHFTNGKDESDEG